MEVVFEVLHDCIIHWRCCVFLLQGVLYGCEEGVGGLSCRNGCAVQVMKRGLKRTA